MNINKGDRIKCIQMKEDPNPIKSGDIGTVSHIDGIGQIHVRWDSGRSLALIPEIDQYELVSKVDEKVKIKDWKSFNG